MLHWLVFFGVTGLAVVILQTLLGDPQIPIADRFGAQVGEFAFLAIVMAALCPAFMLDTIRFSNRFVGPISRFRRHLRDMADGQPTKCQFRGTDFWTDMADEYNEAVELMQQQRTRIEELEAQLEGLAVASPAKS